MPLNGLIVTPEFAAQESAAAQHSNEVSEHVAQNIEAVCAVYARAEENMLPHQRMVERITRFVGRAGFAYGVIGFLATWILLNVALPNPFDPPPFTWLQGITGASALFISTIVVITQHRQGRLNDQRAHLELQISLLAEQKIAKLIALMEELRRDLPSVKNRFDAEATMMERPANPHSVLSALERGLHGDSGDSHAGHLEMPQDDEED